MCSILFVRFLEYVHWTIECVAHFGLFFFLSRCEEISENLIWNSINTYCLSTGFFLFVFYYLSSFALHMKNKVSNCIEYTFSIVLTVKRQIFIEMHILQMGKKCIFQLNYYYYWQTKKPRNCICVNNICFVLLIAFNSLLSKQKSIERWSILR